MIKSLSANKPVPLLFILVFASLLWGGQYKLRHLWEPDEARYTYVAQEMDQSQSWLIPVRNGELYTHKPPLMFWMIKGGTLFTGGEFNGVSGRLPTLIGAVLSLWMIGRIATMWFDNQTAWRFVFILSSSYLFWFKGGTGQIDMLLLGLESTALYLLFRDDARPSFHRPALAFSFMGLAVLAKGPVGLIVPMGIYVTAHLFSGGKAHLKRNFWLWGIPLALLWPGAWLLAAKATGAPPEFFNELLFSQNVGRFTGKFGGHYRPFHYYLKYVFLDFMPWTLLIPGAVATLHHRNRQRLKALLGWILFVLLFFSLCKGKRNLYILSVYPAAAMIIAAAWPEMRLKALKWLQFGTRTTAVLFALLGGALLIAPHFVKLPVSPLTFLPNGLVLAAGAILIFRVSKEPARDRAPLPAMVSVLLLTELLIGMVVFPAFNPLKTPVRLASAAQTWVSPSQELLLYQMNGEIFAYYSKRKGKKIETLESLGEAMQNTGKGIVVFSRKKRNTIENRFSAAGTIHEFQMGGKQLCWLEYEGVGSNKGPGGNIIHKIGMCQP